MTTMNGRSAQYVPGKEVPNKEPPVSKFVVEKLYEVHRRRLQKIEPVVDCHIYIPSFLADTSWKKNADRSKQLVIRLENQDIYNRIAKLEEEEGYFSKDNKNHVRRLEHKLKYLKKLKDHGRMVSVLKIQKENEHFLKRIERAVPQYSIRKCKEWYKHHEMFKEGRKTDPTGGHIMHTVPKNLLPTLPRRSIDSSMFQRNSIASSFESLTNAKSTSSKINNNNNNNSNNSNNNSRNKNKTNIDVGGKLSRSLLENATNNSFLSSSLQSSSQAMMVQPRYALVNRSSSADDYNMRGPYSGSGDTGSDEAYDSVDIDNDVEYYETESFEENPPSSSSGLMMIPSSSSRNFSSSSSELPESDEDKKALAHKGFLEEHLAHLDQLHTVEYDGDDSDKIMLHQRAFHLGFDGNNCIVKVFISKKDFDENVLLKVVSLNTLKQRVYAVKRLSIDKVHEIVSNSAGQITNAGDGQDLQAMSSLMIKMFKDADDDHSGSLTFAEFEKLMEKVDLGISYQELRLIISEADDNDNGVVDYEEFVPLAVDLLQSFRARNRAKNLSTEQDVLIDDEILRSLSTDDLEKISVVCLEKLREFDPKKYGLIKYKDLKKILVQYGVPLGLHENEIAILCQSMPLDQFGRVKYHSPAVPLLDSLMKARFSAMKTSILESRGSGLQKYLMERCKEEEWNLKSKNADHDIAREQGDEFVPLGHISQRSMIQILSTSQKLSLSRLQVVVIMSEATVSDGLINYFQFVPGCAKAIELMFEPLALRQRAELIENTDLSSEALLNGLSADVFEQRLATLFKSVDVDHSGNLDPEEFFMCLQSLELQLTRGEMLALFDQADSNSNKFITFEEFIRFFSHNLLSLEREKHLRQLQKNLKRDKRKKKKGDGETDATVMGDGSDLKLEGSQDLEPDETNKSHEFSDDMIIAEMGRIFALKDMEGTGLVNVDDFHSVIDSFNVNKSRFISEVVMSEFQASADGMINYKDALYTCAEVCKATITKDNAIEEHNEHIKIAEEKALEILNVSSEDIHHMVTFLCQVHEKEKAKSDYITPVIERSDRFKAAIHSPHTGLTKHEANLIESKLLRLQTHSRDVEDTSLHLGSKNRHHFTSTTACDKHFDFVVAFEHEAVYEAVFESRKVCLMRGLMHKFDSRYREKITAYLQQHMNTELENLVARGVLQRGNFFVPISSCFEMLEKSHSLRLNRAHIISIIATADCFDRQLQHMNVNKFVPHAALLISRIHQGEDLEKRVGVLRASQTYVADMRATAATSISNTINDDAKFLSGWRVKELEYYLFDTFSKHHAEQSSKNGLLEVDSQFLRDVLSSIPRLRLTELELSTIVAALNGTSSWEDVVIPAVSTIRALCKERFINRRLTLVAALSNPASFQVMKDLADSLLGYVKINITNDVVEISLINEEDETKARIGTNGDSSALRGDKHSSLGGGGDGIYTSAGLLSSVGLGGDKDVQVYFRRSRIIPLLTESEVESEDTPGRKLSKNAEALTPGVLNRIGSRNESSPTPIAKTPLTRATTVGRESFGSLAQVLPPERSFKVVKEWSSVAVQLLIVAYVESNQFGGQQLRANICSADSDLFCTQDLPIRLPSIGLMDSESAEEFIGNLNEQLYLKRSSDGVLSIEIREDEDRAA